ncbi:MAG TPA: GxGYxYP family putative glycoside hydrolase [Victivallales bacterium]|nr:GxGYxYP family putative glycoside hydrolase [Victivallales bacterium]
MGKSFTVGCILTFLFLLTGFNSAFAGKVPGLPFIKGDVAPASIYPFVVQYGMTNKAGKFPTVVIPPMEDATLITVLQGVVAKYSSDQIFLLNTGIGGDGHGKISYYVFNKKDNKNKLYTSGLFWLNYLTKSKNGPHLKLDMPVNPDPQKAPTVEKYNSKTWRTVEHFKKYIKGYVVYKPETQFQNYAATLCGITDSIPLTISQVNYLKKTYPNWKLPETYNFVTNPQKIKSILDFMRYLDIKGLEFNKNYAIELVPGRCNGGGPLDYAAMTSGLVFYPGLNNKEADAVFKTLNNPVPIYGWNTASVSESNFVGNVSSNGNFVIASDVASNFSFFTSSKAKAERVKYSIPKIKYNPDNIYISYIMSDGDNLCLVTNKANDVYWWGSPYRGEFPVGWTMPPSMFYLEPGIWNYFINSATKNDEFVSGSPGMGFIFGNAKNIKLQQKYLARFMKDSGIHTTAIFGQNNSDWNNKSFFSSITKNPELKGAFYCQFHPWMNQAKKESYKTKWYNKKPIIPENIYLNNTDTAYTTAKNFNKVKNSKRGSFFTVYAIRNDGDNTMEWLHELTDMINEYNKSDSVKKIVVVLPSQMVSLEQQKKLLLSE